MVQSSLNIARVEKIFKSDRRVELWLPLRIDFKRKAILPWELNIKSNLESVDLDRPSLTI